MSDPTTPTPTKPQETRWQRQVIDPIALQMTQGITPEKIALTLAVGSALALFPIFGTTTLLCLLAGVLLRLNQPIIQLVNMLCASIHFPVIVCLFRMGHWMYGVPYTHYGDRRTLQSSTNRSLSPDARFEKIFTRCASRAAQRLDDSLRRSLSAET